jgi:4-carboxymuconolactone decarboxylase
MEDKSKAQKGAELVQKLFGAAAAGAARTGAMPMPADFSRMTMEHLFGDVWQGKELELAERSLITCTVLVTLARENELRAHLRGARNVGISREKLQGMIAHVAHYAGWPVAVAAFRALDEVWTAMDKEAQG